MQKKIQNKINFYKENGYCILKLLDISDINYIEKNITKLIFPEKKNKNKLIENYHKLVNDDYTHNQKMDSSKRYIKLNKKINCKLRGEFLKIITKSYWGHSKFDLFWVGNTKKGELKKNHTGFRISRPQNNIKSDDSAGVHIDRNIGGELRKEADLVITMWIPIKGYSKNYTLRIAPKSHKINHSVAFKKNSKITPVISKKYENKFSFIRPNMKKGEVMIINPNLLHGGSTNKGSKSRVSLDIRAINLKKIKNIVN